jgi:aminoglycoside phosphotransferase family enzyme/predicted kinase
MPVSPTQSASRQVATAGADDQREVIEFLGCPKTYGVERVERLETHGNLVFLAGADAYKIKRAVRFGYMDFSSLAKRRGACHREVEVNRRWAPDLYLGCVAITRRPDGTLTLDGAGEVVEWGVHMRRFEQSDLLKTRAERSQLDRPLAMRLAYAVFASHKKAERNLPLSGVDPYRDLVGSICHGLAAADVFDERIGRLAEGLRLQVDRAAAILDARAAHGFVRRCHGDLHLANIVLYHGKPTLYDAIEFDEALATIDTLYDLAFLLMDLDFQGQRPEANVVLNRYLYCSGDDLDLKGLAALPLFLALRAAIRALVTSDRAAQEGGQGRARELERAWRYLSAAVNYATPAAPKLVVVGGLSGTGKTTLAAALAPSLGAAPGAVHLSSDLERKLLAGVGEFERLPVTAYTPEARQRVYRSLHEKAVSALQAQHSVIIDAVYENEGHRREIEILADSLQTPLLGLWLRADAATLVARIVARHNDASDATPEVVQRQLTAEIGPLSARWATLDAGNNAAETLAAAMSAIGQKKPC